MREPRAKARWVVSLHPDAAEAGGSLQHTGARPRPPSSGGGPARAKAEAGRRARTKVRLYCAANRLNRLGTLTYAGAGVSRPEAGQGGRRVSSFAHCAPRDKGDVDAGEVAVVQPPAGIVD